MHNRLKPGDRRAVVEHHGGKLGAIDPSAHGRTWKRLLDSRHCFAFIERMHGGIGIVHWNTGLGEKSCRGRLSHAERARKTQNKRPFATLRRTHDSMNPCSRRKPNTSKSGRPKTVK